MCFVLPMSELMSDSCPLPQEISDDLSGCLAQYMAQPLPSASAAAVQKGYVTYTAPRWDTNVPQTTLLEAPSLLAASGTTGLRTWEAALFLGTYLISEAGRKHVNRQKIIELGAGTGFLSILCAKYLNARYVLTTDGSREVVAELKANLELNNLEEGDLIKSAVLEWGHTLIGGPADYRGADSPYDLVIGADVVREFLLSLIFLGIPNYPLKINSFELLYTTSVSLIRSNDNPYPFADL